MVNHLLVGIIGNESVGSQGSDTATNASTRTAYRLQTVQQIGNRLNGIFLLTWHALDPPTRSDILRVLS